MATITKSLTIESQGTYNLTFDLWSYSEWAASAGITTSYASLAALIADEKAVRQLMTVHASVDYFANCPDSTIISTVINNDLCAKWINLRDYAFDALSAKSNIKSVMDTADKYGYGEWGKIDSTTWGALGNVPIMTANNAPYGTALRSGIWSGSSYEAWMAFDGNDTDRWVSASNTAGQWIGYEFVNPIKPKRVHLKMEVLFESGYVQGSNSSDFSNPDNLYEFSSLSGREIDFEIPDTAGYYKYLRVYCTNSGGGYQSNYKCYRLQFYGRELTPLVPTMTSNTTPKGTASMSSTAGSTTPAYKAFDNTGDTYPDCAQPGTSPSNWYLMYEFSHTVNIGAIFVRSIRYSSAVNQQTANVQYYEDGQWKTAGTRTYNNSATFDTYIKDLAIATDKIRIAGTVSSGETIAVSRFQAFGPDYSEKEFAPGSTRKTIYDHGVELVTIESKTIRSGSVARKEANQLYISIPTTASTQAIIGGKVNFSGRNYLYAKAGNKFKANSTIGYFTSLPSSVTAPTGYIVLSDANGKASLEPSLDISSVSGENYAVINSAHSAAGSACEATIKELWLE